jgi:hypothetical protein
MDNWHFLRDHKRFTVYLQLESKVRRKGEDASAPKRRADNPTGEEK